MMIEKKEKQKRKFCQFFFQLFKLLFHTHTCIIIFYKDEVCIYIYVNTLSEFLTKQICFCKEPRDTRRGPPFHRLSCCR